MTHASFTLEHARRLRFVRDAGFAGDADLYYTVAAIDDDLRERNSLWLFDLEAARARPGTAELGDVRSPSPSPDGSVIAVLAEIDGAWQIVLVPADGGQARPLTALARGATGRPVWSPDGRSIAFAAGPAKPRDAAAPYWVDRVTYRSDGLGYLDDVVTDLYTVDVETGAVRRLTDDRNMNSDPRWSPDGRSLCYLVSFPPDREWTWLPEVHVLELASGQSRTLVGNAWGGAVAAEWHPDGSRIAFIGARAGQTLISAQQQVDVWMVSAEDAEDAEPECRTASVLAGLGRPQLTNDLPVGNELFAPRLRVHDGVAYVGGQTGGRTAVYRVALDGPETVDQVVATEGSACLADYHPSRGVLYLATSFVDTPELMLGDQRITELNAGLLADVAGPQVRALTVTAPDGLQTEAWALTPPGDGPWPTTLYIHGGPFAGATGSIYMIDFQLLTGAGFAVVTGNFRGSLGYGTEFSAKMHGDWGRNGSLDHHALLDEAIRTGIADPARLGVFGLSHGGFATCWLTATSDRFKAAVAENPATSFTTWFGTMDTAWWFAGEFGGTPDEVPDVYRDRSPLSYAAGCETPLLLVVGESDMCCHPIESEQFYRVLRSRGVPTAMLRLPGTAHGGTHTGPVPARIAQNEALLDWFRRYLA
jgi:dipeptidyl aminopeptidase/acylaminoacyl peptidase